jgi:hypothetical protein
MTQLNELGTRVRDSILGEHPEWANYVDVRDSGDVEVAVPAPAGSRAGHLVISTDRGEGIWIRFAPPYMFYSVESDHEMHTVINALLADDAFFVVITNGDEWLETALYRPGEEPILTEGQVATAVSWSGTLDRVVTYMKV